MFNIRKKLKASLLIISASIISMTTIATAQYREFEKISEFQNGYAAVKKDGKLGIIDKSKKQIVPLVYSAIGEDMFTHGYAAVMKGDKWGIVDKNGNLVVDTIYDAIGIELFTYGYALVKRDNKWGMIDKSGNKITEYIYDGIGDFKNGYIPAIKNGKWGFLNKEGKEITNFEYESIDFFNSQGNASVKKDGKWGVINNSGEYIVPLIYDRLDKNIQAKLNSSEIYFNGELIDLYGYNIDNNNYFKIRDIAKILEDTTKGFNVEWDIKDKVINLTSQKHYISIGNELEKIGKDIVTPRFNTTKVYKDGEETVLASYVIDGSTYFKLRDIADLFGIEVEWNRSIKAIEISTGEEDILLMRR